MQVSDQLHVATILPSEKLCFIDWMGGCGVVVWQSPSASFESQRNSFPIRELQNRFLCCPYRILITRFISIEFNFFYVDF